MKCQKPKFKIGSYIQAQETIEKASKASLSICDYLEQTWDQVGATQNVIDQMQNYQVFENNPIDNILEIGTGSGRYLEKVIQVTTYTNYYSYETQDDWSQWLENKYPIQSINSDGFSLSSTLDNSIDLLHSHGVFVYLPFLISLRYFYEIFRVTKKGSYVVFDVYDESCFDKQVREQWLNSSDVYPVILPQDYIRNLFSCHGFTLIQDFYNKHGHGKSKYLIFKRLK